MEDAADMVGRNASPIPVIDRVSDTSSDDSMAEKRYSLTSVNPPPPPPRIEEIRPISPPVPPGQEADADDPTGAHISEKTIKFEINIAKDFQSGTQITSHSVYARGMPWKILLQKRNGGNPPPKRFHLPNEALDSDSDLSSEGDEDIRSHSDSDGNSVDVVLTEHPLVDMDNELSHTLLSKQIVVPSSPRESEGNIATILAHEDITSSAPSSDDDANVILTSPQVPSNDQEVSVDTTTLFSELKKRSRQSVPGKDQVRTSPKRVYFEQDTFQDDKLKLASEKSSDEHLTSANGPVIVNQIDNTLASKIDHPLANDDPENKSNEKLLDSILEDPMITQPHQRRRGAIPANDLYSKSKPDGRRQGANKEKSQNALRNSQTRRVLRSETQRSRAADNASLGFFLQCNASGKEDGWTCHGTGYLRVMPSRRAREKRKLAEAKDPDERTAKEKRLLNSAYGQPMQKHIQHNFNSRENDWGFTNFVAWKELMSEKSGYRSQTGRITVECDLFADAPHGTAMWDSKRNTGYVGLKNQGATCYMNSVLQALFFTNCLRDAIFQIPTDNEDSQRSIPLALQRVFYELQSAEGAVGTRALTRAFGWDTYEAFMQHDAQEMIRVLIDKLECKMKGTKVENNVKRLFEGKTISYIKCKNVDYGREHEETFYDIQLPVRLESRKEAARQNSTTSFNAFGMMGPSNDVPQKTTILESFDEYVRVDNLDGDNKWQSGNEYGLQDAVKGIKFKKFPPVLHLQLMRFQYDPYTDSNVKINDKFQFSEKLDLTSFEQDAQVEMTDESSNTPSEDKPVYKLHAVLVHSGEHHGGHYVAYIDPKCTGKWFKFDDDIVSPVSSREAIEANYGGEADERSTLSLLQKGRENTNAYMLIYVRECHVQEVTRPCNDICDILVQRLKKEMEIEAIRKREKENAILYMNCNVITDECFHHPGEDLIDSDSIALKTFKVRKAGTINYFYKTIGEIFKMEPSQFRLWTFQKRDNQTWRPFKVLHNVDDPEEERRSQMEDDCLKETERESFRRTMQSIKMNKNRVINYQESPNTGLNVWLEIVKLHPVLEPLPPLIDQPPESADDSPLNSQHSQDSSSQLAFKSIPPITLPDDAPHWFHHTRSPYRLVFFKHYCPLTSLLSYVGHVVIPKSEPVQALIEIFLARVGLDRTQTFLRMYEDFNKRNPNNELLDGQFLIAYDPAKKPDLRGNGYYEQIKQMYGRLQVETVEQVIEDCTNGDLVIFETYQCQLFTRFLQQQKEMKLLKSKGMRIPRELFRVSFTNLGKYFNRLYNTVEIHVVEHAPMSDGEFVNAFVLKVGLSDSFNELVRLVAETVQIGDDYLQFFEHDVYREAPKSRAIPSGSSAVVQQHALYDQRQRGRGIRKIYYKKLDIPLSEYERLCQIPISYAPGSNGLGDQTDFTVSVSQTDTLARVFEEVLRLSSSDSNHLSVDKASTTSKSPRALTPNSYVSAQTSPESNMEISESEAETIKTPTIAEEPKTPQSVMSTGTDPNRTPTNDVNMQITTPCTVNSTTTVVSSLPTLVPADMADISSLDPEAYSKPERYRLLELHNHRVQRVWHLHESVEAFYEHILTAPTSRQFRMEPIPEGQYPYEIAKDEVLVTVFHFHNHIGQVHSAPFLIKLSINGVFIQDVCELIQSVTKTKDKEFERWKLALVQNTSSQPRYVHDKTDTFCLTDLIPRAAQMVQHTTEKTGSVLTRCCIGLDHPGKTSRAKSRSNAPERGIKIRN